MMPEAIAKTISNRQRSYICLNVFVLAQHGYFEKAALWLDVLHRLDDRSEHVLFARASTCFLAERYAAALAALQELDLHYPLEKFGKNEITDRHKMRHYMKARSLFELKKLEHPSPEPAALPGTYDPA